VKQAIRKTRVVALVMMMAAMAFAADPGQEEVRAPHTPALVFYLTGLDSAKDTAAIGTEVAKLKSASVLEVNAARGYAHVQFDSHVVSYHQVAQAIADAGKSVGKTYDPYLVFTVAAYSKGDNAAAVDKIFAGKKLRTRVNVTPIDASRGMFAVHFLPLTVDPADPAPQGFNGGHLHHPVSDPPPRGLGLESGYQEKIGPTTRDAEAKASTNARK